MKYKKIILVLVVLELLMAAWLAYQDLTAKTNVCLIGKSCDYVQSSAYSQIFGIKLPYIAIFAFAGLLVLYFAKEKWFLAAAGFGALISVYLLIVQFFILKQICTNCTIVDSLMLAIFGISLLGAKD